MNAHANRACDPWTLKCAWCSYSIGVSGRGGRGRDQGAGFAAAATMQQHTLEAHGKTWKEFLHAEPWRAGEEERRYREGLQNLPQETDDPDELLPIFDDEEAARWDGAADVKIIGWATRAEIERGVGT